MSARMMIRASLAAVVLVAIAGSAAVSANDDDMAVTSGAPKESLMVSLELDSSTAELTADGLWIVQIKIMNLMPIKGMTIQMFYENSSEPVVLNGTSERGVGEVENQHFNVTCNNIPGVFAMIGVDNHTLEEHSEPTVLVELVLDQKNVDPKEDICFKFFGVADEHGNEIPPERLQYPKCNCKSETCGISTFEQLLNSVANADTFPDWIFNPSEHDKLESSIDNKTSDNRYIVFVPLQRKNLSDNNVVGNHVAVGSYLQIIQWIFFGFTRLDTISQSVQLDMYTDKNTMKWMVDGIEIKDAFRTYTGFVALIRSEMILAKSEYKPHIIPSRSVAYMRNANETGIFWSILKSSGIAEELHLYNKPTIFVPSDKAFEHMIKNTSNNINSTKQLITLDKNTLRTLVQSHIVNNTLKSTDIYNKREDMSANGIPIVFDIKLFRGGIKLVEVKTGSNVANILEFDYKTDDGIIHEVDSVLWSPDDIPLNGDAEYQIQGSVSFGIHNSKCFNSSNDVINVFYSSDVDIHKFAIGIDVVMKSSSPSEQDILSLTKAMGDKGWDARLIEDDNIVMGFSNGSSSITASPDREQELFTLEANVIIENACFCINDTRTSAYWGLNGTEWSIKVDVDHRSSCRGLKNLPPDSHFVPNISPNTHNLNPIPDSDSTAHIESTPSPEESPSSSSSKDDYNGEEQDQDQERKPMARQPYEDLFVVTVAMLAILAMMVVIALSLRWRMRNARKNIYKAILMRERIDIDADIS